MIHPPSTRSCLRARTRHVSALPLLALALAAGACGDAPTAARRDEDPVVVDSVPLSRVDGAARRLYDRLATGEDPAPVVRELLVPLLPVLDPAGDRARIERFLDAGDPVVPTTTIAAVSDALARGHLVRLESFFLAAAQRGARDASSGEPLDHHDFGAHLAALRTRDLVARDEVIPALVGALGRERMRRAGHVTFDAAWGDAGLDPLQLLLLSYALHFAGGTAGAAARHDVALPAASRLQLAGAGGWLVGDAGTATPGRARDVVFDRVAEWANFPVAVPAHASLCLPLVLFRHHFASDAINATLGTRVVDTSRVTGAILNGTTLGGAPETEIQLTAIFPGVETAAAWLVARAGCALPAQAPFAGRVVHAEMEGHLPSLVTLAPNGNTTNASGAWTGRLHAAGEVVPTWLRVVTRTDSGVVHLSTTGMVEGWGPVRLMVGSNAAAKHGERLVIRVHHFALPRELEVNVRTQYRWGQRAETLDGHVTGLMTGRLVLDPFEPTYVAEHRDVLFNYASLGWEPRTATCTPSFGGVGGPVPMQVRLRDETAAGPAGIRVQFTSDAQGELPRERLVEHCDGQGRDTHWFTHFWRVARRGEPIALRGSHWSRPEPGVLSTNFGNAAMDDGAGNWWGEWIWIELRAMP